MQTQVGRHSMPISRQAGLLRTGSSSHLMYAFTSCTFPLAQSFQTQSRRRREAYPLLIVWSPDDRTGKSHFIAESSSRSSVQQRPWSRKK